LSPSYLTSAFGKLFFVSGRHQLWKSDGTYAGTVMVNDFAEKSVGILMLLSEKIILHVADYVETPPTQAVTTWHLYQSDGSQTGLQWIGDFHKYVQYCTSAQAGCGPPQHEDSVVTNEKWFFESLDGPSNTPRTWVLTDVYFKDVALDHWAYPSVEKLANTGITAGCNLDQFCPDNSVTRAQMAVFLLKGMHGPSYSPPSVNGDSGFNDVAADNWAAPWIKQLAVEGITSGCGDGNYCPENTVTRAQMALFLLKTKNGSSYAPPAVGGSTGFNDVATDYWAAPWIKQLVAESITSGCGGGSYCPDASVTRAQMAVFLVKAFNLS
jgi:ELWxxDGT repeat protein